MMCALMSPCAPLPLEPFCIRQTRGKSGSASAFEKAGAGRMIVQRELTPERLAEELLRLIENPGEVDRMEEASRRLGRADAAACAVDLALSVVRQGAKNQVPGNV